VPVNRHHWFELIKPRLMSNRHSIDVSLSEIAGRSGLNSALVRRSGR
jgi:hypothetical protein